MSQASIPTDLYVAGNLSCKTFSPPAASISDNAITGGSGNYVQSSKLQQRRQQVYSNGASNANAATEQRVVYVVRGATATLLEFAAGAVVILTGNDTCTIDLWKNGATILTATIALASSDTIRALKTAAGYTSTSLVAGDVLEVKVTATHNTGTLPQGVFARITLTEDPV